MEGKMSSVDKEFGQQEAWVRRLLETVEPQIFAGHEDGMARLGDFLSGRETNVALVPFYLDLSRGWKLRSSSLVSTYSFYVCKEEGGNCELDVSVSASSPTLTDFGHLLVVPGSETRVGEQPYYWLDIYEPNREWYLPMATMRLNPTNPRRKIVNRGWKGIGEHLIVDYLREANGIGFADLQPFLFRVVASTRKSVYYFGHADEKVCFRPIDPYRNRSIGSGSILAGLPREGDPDSPHWIDVFDPFSGGDVRFIDSVPLPRPSRETGFFVEEGVSGGYISRDGKRWRERGSLLQIYGLASSTVDSRLELVERCVVNGHIFFDAEKAVEALDVFVSLPELQEGEEGCFYAEIDGELMVSIDYIHRNLGISKLVWEKRSDLVRSMEARTAKKIPTTVYSLSSIEGVFEDYLSLPDTSDGEKYIDEENTEWVTLTYLEQEYSFSRINIYKALDGLQTLQGRSRGKPTAFLYRLDDARERLKQKAELPYIDPETQLYTDPSGRVWMPATMIGGKYGQSRAVKQAMRMISRMLARTQSDRRCSLVCLNEFEECLKGLQAISRDEGVVDMEEMWKRLFHGEDYEE